MEASGSAENRVVSQTSEGLEFEGAVVQLGRHEVVFEIFAPTMPVQVSEVLKAFKVYLRGQMAYSGRAVIKSAVASASGTVCSAALDSGWKLEFSKSDLESKALQSHFKEYLRDWQKLSVIRPEFKLHVAEMESFLSELRQWLGQMELGICASELNGSSGVVDEVAQKLGDSVLPNIDAMFQRFEELADKLPEDLQPIHRTYMQRRLHPLVLCAPFAHRTFTKPLGYAGDYEMVNMIARNRPEGESLFAKVVNLWFVRQAPAAAHRNRLTILTQRLVEETARVASRKGRIRILSVACGPAVEAQNFLRQHEVSSRADLALLDFNEETLEYVRKCMLTLKSSLDRGTPVSFIKRSVHQLIKDSVRSSPKPAAEQYDFVYCAGLFDYLTDTVCQRLMTLLYDWVGPDGLLLATNVEPSNPMRRVMEHCLDWQLIYRTAAQCKRLCPSQVEPNDFLVRADFTGVNLFMEARKPANG
jgi:extracellular factor (EF) 3-hydroxypalmitic acid methyl ester biosynthesis protein